MICVMAIKLRVQEWSGRDQCNVLKGYSLSGGSMKRCKYALASLSSINLDLTLVVTLVVRILVKRYSHHSQYDVHRPNEVVAFV